MVWSPCHRGHSIVGIVSWTQVSFWCFTIIQRWKLTLVHSLHSFITYSRLPDLSPTDNVWRRLNSSSLFIEGTNTFFFLFKSCKSATRSILSSQFILVVHTLDLWVFNCCAVNLTKRKIHIISNLSCEARKVLVRGKNKRKVLAVWSGRSKVWANSGCRWTVQSQRPLSVFTKSWWNVTGSLSTYTFQVWEQKNSLKNPLGEWVPELFSGANIYIYGEQSNDCDLWTCRTCKRHPPRE